jgi:hypothetical protein
MARGLVLDDGSPPYRHSALRKSVPRGVHEVPRPCMGFLQIKHHAAARQSSLVIARMSLF